MGKWNALFFKCSSSSLEKLSKEYSSSPSTTFRHFSSASFMPKYISFVFLCQWSPILFRPCPGSSIQMNPINPWADFPPRVSGPHSAPNKMMHYSRLMQTGKNLIIFWLLRLSFKYSRAFGSEFRVFFSRAHASPSVWSVRDRSRSRPSYMIGSRMKIMTE